MKRPASGLLMALLLAVFSSPGAAAPPDSLEIDTEPGPELVEAALDSLIHARGSVISAAFAGDIRGMTRAAATREAGMDLLARAIEHPEWIEALPWPIRTAWLQAALREHRPDWIRDLCDVLDGRPPEPGLPSRGEAALTLGLAVRSLMDLDPEEEGSYLGDKPERPLEEVARTAFGIAVEESFPLRDEAIYQLWSLAEGEGDTLAALAWADSLVGRYPRSLRTPEVRITRARSLLRQGEPALAAEEARLSMPAIDTAEIRWLLAEASLAMGLPRSAALELEHLITHFPADPLALRGWEERQALGSIDSTLVLGAAGRIPLLTALLQPSQGPGEPGLLEAARDTTLEPALREDARLALGRFWYAQKRYPDAASILESLETADRPAVAEESILLRARMHRNQGRLVPMESLYRKLMEGNGTYASRAVWELGREFESQSKWKEAEAVYTLGIDRFGGSSKYREMLFRRGFDRFRQGRLDGAAADFRAAYQVSRTAVDQEQAAFWRARVLLEAGRTQDAERAAQAGFSRPRPAGAYGVLLRERFPTLAPALEEPDRMDPSLSIFDAIDATEWPGPVADLYERGLMLAEMGQFAAARREWARGAELGRAYPSLLQSLALVASAYNIYPEGVHWARRGGDALPNGHPYQSGFERLTYPPAYYGDVIREAAEEEVDPFSLWALMRQESLYDPAAVSRAGALGLMQLMPKTFHRILQDAGRPALPTEALFIPRVNIAMGTRFFADRLDEFGGKLLPTLASYNAGESKCWDWLERAGGDDQEVFIESIGYPETYDYVQRILWLKWVYQDYYGPRDVPSVEAR